MLDVRSRGRPGGIVNPLGAIICFFKGHKRGVRNWSGVLVGVQMHEKIFNCPRCGRETRYKVKPDSANNGTPTDGSPSLREAA